jgi:hypothetical protein
MPGLIATNVIRAMEDASLLGFLLGWLPIADSGLLGGHAPLLVACVIARCR